MTFKDLFNTRLAGNWRDTAWACAAAGLLGWHQGSSELFTAALVLLPAIVLRAGSPLGGALAAFVFYLSMSRYVALDSPAFFDSPWRGAATSFALAALLAVPWGAARRYPKSLPLVLVALALPPLGLFAIGHPLNASGFLFPGTGLFGVVATAGLALALLPHPEKGLLRLPGAVVALVLLTVSVGLNAAYQGPEVREVVSTHMGRYASDSALNEMRFVSKAFNTLEAQAQGESETVMLPENLLGVLTPAKAQWVEVFGARLAASGKLLAAGALVPKTGVLEPSLLLAKGGQQARAVVRVGVPFSYRDSTTPERASGFFAKPYVDLAGGRYGSLICYEALLAPMAASAAATATNGVVVLANNWWTRSTSNIAPVQLHTAHSWSRLFNQPLYFASNFPAHD